MIKFKLPYDLIVLDLEMNQPSGTIIEIGAVRFLRDGGIHPDKFDVIVNPHEKLGVCDGGRNGAMTITELTGITQEMVDEAVDLEEAIEQMHQWVLKESKNVVLAGWGGDPYWLRTEVIKNGIQYPFRNKSFDVKSMVVFISALMGKKHKTDGLGSMMKCYELKFEGNQHRADADAYNTARLLQKTIKDYNKFVDMILSGIKGLNRLK